MRINWSDDEELPGQLALWEANCRRSIRGRLGQRELRELEAALLALPNKRLIHGLLNDERGDVCAIGAYAKHKGLDLSKFDPEYDSDEVGIAAGMPRLVAWKVISLNDIHLHGWYGYAEGPDRTPVYPSYAEHHGVWTFFPYTPEERYEKVLAWVREQLVQAGGGPRTAGEDQA